jgi:hypothetical protein
MDFIVGLHHTLAGYNSIWVIMDRLTKVAHFILVKSTYSRAKRAELYKGSKTRTVPVFETSKNQPVFKTELARFCKPTYTCPG